MRDRRRRYPLFGNQPGVRETCLGAHFPVRRLTPAAPHPRVGAEFVNKIHKLEKVAEIIYAHQEKYDGSGYPEGLKGDNIPLGARILSIADTYDAITNLRLHKKSGDHQEAVEELERLSGKHYDPAIVEIFLRIF